MAHVELYLLDGDAVGHKEAGAGVPEVVEPDVAQTVLFQQGCEGLGKVFSDVDGASWYADSVTFVTARETSSYAYSAALPFHGRPAGRFLLDAASR